MKIKGISIFIKLFTSIVFKIVLVYFSYKFNKYKNQYI